MRCLVFNKIVFTIYCGVTEDSFQNSWIDDKIVYIYYCLESHPTASTDMHLLMNLNNLPFNASKTEPLPINMNCKFSIFFQIYLQAMIVPNQLNQQLNFV